MFGKNDEKSLYGVQKKSRPKLEDAIIETLRDTQQKNALDFCEFLRANRMSPRWTAANAWRAIYKKDVVCYIRIHGTARSHSLSENEWHIDFGKYDRKYDNDVSELKETAWENVKPCTKCGPCGPGGYALILGKEFENVCHSYVVIRNPDGVHMAYALKLAEAIRDIVQSREAKMLRR